jgi:radical SAM protein with 4Fe4S-binding SPASM domain
VTRIALRPLGPSWLVFQLLERCNLRCRMCYEWGDQGTYHARPELAELELDLVLRSIAECAPTRPFVELFGGEPLLYRGIDDVLDALAAAQCPVAFPTNGTRLAQHAERLVSKSPRRVWVSLDGPRAVNDAQRGAGVYERATEGIAAVVAAKRRSGLPFPELGVTCVVTPDNYEHIADLFVELDLTQLAAVSVEVQSFLTAEQHRHYARIASDQFGVPATPCAAGYVRAASLFEDVDPAALCAQVRRVRECCVAAGVRFFSQPRELDIATFAAYLGANWSAMPEFHDRCAVPWLYAEVSARGDVTTCHSFYDITIGNIHDAPLLDIWRGARAEAVRAHLRDELFPICTACCRYYSATSDPIGGAP